MVIAATKDSQLNRRSPEQDRLTIGSYKWINLLLKPSRYHFHHHLLVLVEAVEVMEAG